MLAELFGYSSSLEEKAFFPGEVMVAVSYPHWGNDDYTRGGDRTIEFLAVQVSVSTVVVVARLEEI